MSFLRPEVAAGLVRWREVLAGSAVAAFGLWLAATSYGALFLIGCGITALGAGLVTAGVPRARFRSGGGGAGVVDVDERQITYFGPFGGGAVALGDIAEIGIDPSRCWLIRDVYGKHLMIPLTAEGADALFDAFSALPGLGASDLVAAARETPDRHTVVWSHPHRRLH